MAGSVIRSIEIKLFEVPLVEIMTDAMHGDHSHFELITVTITDSAGCTGTGYTYTGGRGGHAILAMLEHDLKPLLLGQDVTDIASLYRQMIWHIHYVGRGGIASFAISAMDIALWDIRCIMKNQPLSAVTVKFLPSVSNQDCCYWMLSGTCSIHQNQAIVVVFFHV